MRAITPYLNFDGQCREAMTFYQSCLGGELQLSAFGEGGVEGPPGSEGRVMHARLEAGPAVLMASDTMPGMPYEQGNHVWLTIECESPEELERHFASLVAGGTEVMSPQDTFWGARFAMLVDRFGMSWMLNAELPK